LLLVFREDGVGGAEAIERRASLIVAADYAPWMAVVAGNDDLLLQMHHRLEEVVVCSHLVIESIDGQHMFDRVETVVAKVMVDQRGVFLLDARIVVSVIRTASRQDHALYPMAPESQHVMIEELGAIVRVNLQHGERKASQEDEEGVLHHQGATAKHSSTLAPAGGYVDPLDGIDILS
jgi:hypothetical protein